MFKQDSKINTSSADAAGFSTFNHKSALIDGCKNFAEIYQFSDIEGWSPNVAGVSLMNYGLINNSFNFSKLEIQSTYLEEENQGTIFLGGIVCQNFSEISNCLNKANLLVNSSLLNVYCGGIAAYSTYDEVTSVL